MVDRRNRLRWALIALLLVAAGVAGSLISFDRLPQVGADTPLLPDAAVARWRQAEDWRLAALAALGLLLALYGWRILAAQLRRGGGRTTMGDIEEAAGFTRRLNARAQTMASLAAASAPSMSTEGSSSA